MKKCPYCAEDIQDEAVVCKHCGRDLRTGQLPAAAIPPAPKKKRNTLLIVIGALVLLCLCGVIGALNMPKTDNAAVAGANKAAGSPTPRPQLGMDLNQFVSKYDSLTDIQKKDFVAESKGKWVDWSGEVNEVRSDGTILVNIPGSLLSLVDLGGVSAETAKGINKGQTVRFTGRIDSVTEMLATYIYLKEVEIK